MAGVLWQPDGISRLIPSIPNMHIRLTSMKGVVCPAKLGPANRWKSGQGKDQTAL